MTAANAPRTARVQREGTIPWAIFLEAYESYAKKWHGQSAERLAQRGGFCALEMDEFRPGWREYLTPFSG